jgi:hypothetical protein
MAENTRMEFTLTYPNPLDQVAADKQRDIRHSEGLAAEQELMDAPDVPGRSGEQTKKRETSLAPSNRGSGQENFR